MMKIATAAAGLALASLIAVAGTGQLRPAAAQANSGAASGEAVFLQECGMCHLSGGTGTMMLERRVGAEKSLLAERTDLPPQYIEMVVRQGINSMPTITRVEIPDAELQAIIGYLTRNSASASRGGR